jgi:general secretion pathway protein K
MNRRAGDGLGTRLPEGGTQVPRGLKPTPGQVAAGNRRKQRGGALLAVLWLSAALSAIAFAVAISVRGEVSRTETSVEGLRAQYLASGALDRALHYMLYGPGPRLPDGRPRFWEQGMPLLVFTFPGGDAAVEIIPESSRLNVNTVQSEQLLGLLLAMGLAELPARQITSAIIDWRSPGAGGGRSPFDPIYLARSPSFRPPHASLEQIEELLSVAGVTPEMFHGRYERGPDGRIVRRAGLKHCLSVYSTGGPLDINTVEPELMIALGVPPPAAQSVAELRRRAPVTRPQLDALRPLLGPAASRFRLGGDNIYTLRATARPRRADGSLSDLRRSASMIVQLYSRHSAPGPRVLRWQVSAAGDPMLFDVWAQ